MLPKGMNYMGEVVKLVIARPVPLPESFVTAWRVLGLSDPGEPIGFQFRRSRENGVQVWLFFKGGLRLNLTLQNGTDLKNFYDARGWAHGYAVKHGFKAFEIKKKRKAKPKPVLRLV